jgi:excisionase family DNA binding protein
MPEPKDNQSPSLLTYREAARMLGLPRGTIYSMVHHNQIPHVRLGKRLVRFDVDELRRFVDEHRVEARSA